MLLADIEDDEEFTKEEFHEHREEIKNIKDEDLVKEPYVVGEHSLEVGEMSQKEFDNLPEFEGY